MKLGIIGFGSMAQAIVTGLLKQNAISGDDIYASAGRYDKLQKNCELFGCHPCKTTEEVIEQSDMVMIALKPNMIESVITPVKELLKDKLVVSIAAGYTYDDYKGLLCDETHYICTIPNTPVAVGEGIIICDRKHSLNEAEYKMFDSLFSSIGLVKAVDSALLSVGGTVAGCTPAFASMFIEALGDAGLKYGLSRDTAYELAAQMMIGTGKLYMETKTHPGEMKDAVCSPGGTTIRGVAALEKHGFRNAIISAIDEIEG